MRRFKIMDEIGESIYAVIWAKDADAALKQFISARFWVSHGEVYAVAF